MTKRHAPFRDYTAEAVQTMTQWAFQQKDVVFAEAETEPENKVSQRVSEMKKVSLRELVADKSVYAVLLAVVRTVLFCVMDKKVV